MITLIIAVIVGFIAGRCVSKVLVDAVIGKWDGSWYAPVGKGVLYKYRWVARVRHPRSEIIFVGKTKG